MSKPNPRPTRSRISSPFVSGPPTNAASNHPHVQEPEKQKTFLDKWVEPALPAPRPSFAEAGLVRHGVLATMAPLGTRPTGKALKGALRLDGEGAGRGRKSRGATPAVALSKEARDSPEPAASRRGSIKTGEEEQITPETVGMQKLEMTTETSSPSDETQGKQEDQAKEHGVFIRQPSTPQRPSTSMSIRATPDREEPKMSQTDKIVDLAVQEAVDEKRWPTAFALRTLYDDSINTGDKRLADLFEAVGNQTTDRSQLEEFHCLLRARKRLGKRHQTAEYYFRGAGGDLVSPQPHHQSSPAGKRPITPRVTRSSRQSSVNHVTSQPSHEHMNKKQKGNNFKSAKLQLNGHAIGAQDQPFTPQENDPSRQDSNSGSNSSPLSSVDEKVLDTDYGDSPAPKARPHVSEDTQRRLQSITSAITGNAPPKFVSPYANAQTFAATAETLAGFAARNYADLIRHGRPASPKTLPFSTSPAPELPHPSSSKSLPITDEENQVPPSPPSSDPQMAPTATTADHLSPSNGHLEADASGQAELSSHAPRKEEDLLTVLKRKARQTTEMSVKIEDSFVRGVPTTVSQENGSPSDGGDPFVANPSRRPPKVRLFNRETKPKYNYDSEDLSSPTFLDFRPDLAPGSIATSRAGTPASTRPTRKAKTGSGLRVKTSPMKKKGALAGMPRASGERNSPVANGAPNNQDENDDYCSACGGNGALVCCDTCPRSFHFKCVDPPMDEDSLPDEEWFCNLCASSRLPRQKVEAKGTFGDLLAILERKNPSAFHLPYEVRDYFVDVKTGTEGEYEDVITQKPKKVAGYDEVPDHFRLKDAKGTAILCHQCNGMASVPDRGIIPCTYCGLSWHLDCIPVPMANPPVPGRAWRCPAHVDDLLAEIPRSLRPAHRFRRIKGIPPIEPALSRGILNNGHIEIQNDPDEAEEEQGFFEYTEYGKIYKLPELGIKLDFIAKVRETTGGGYASVVNRKHKRQDPSYRMGSRTIPEQQAALNLMSLVSQDPVSGPSSLYETLLAKAPKVVVDMVAQGDAENIHSGRCTERDRHSLLALRALIDARLSVPSDLDGMPPTSSGEASEKLEEANEVEMVD